MDLPRSRAERTSLTRCDPTLGTRPTVRGPLRPRSLLLAARMQRHDLSSEGRSRSFARVSALPIGRLDTSQSREVDLVQGRRQRRRVAAARRPRLKAGDSPPSGRETPLTPTASATATAFAPLLRRTWRNSRSRHGPGATGGEVEPIVETAAEGRPPEERTDAEASSGPPTGARAPTPALRRANAPPDP